MRCRVRLLTSLCAAGAVACLAGWAQAEVTVDHPSPKLQQPDQNGKQADNGRHVFMAARCFACHGEYGFGGVGPRFRDNRFLAMGDYVVGQILLGRDVMPSFANALDDKQIAAVASYIRNSWGNQYGQVNPDEVAKVRNQIKAEGAENRPHVMGPYLPKNQPPDLPMQPEKALPPGQPLPPKAAR